MRPFINLYFSKPLDVAVFNNVRFEVIHSGAPECVPLPLLVFKSYFDKFLFCKIFTVVPYCVYGRYPVIFSRSLMIYYLIMPALA